MKKEKFIIIIKTPEAQYDEVYDGPEMDQSFGHQWFHKIDPKDEEGGCHIVDTIMRVIRENKNSYSCIEIKRFQELQNDPQYKDLMQCYTGAVKFTLPVRKSICRELTDEEAKLAEILIA